jgi:hypothetical protein
MGGAMIALVISEAEFDRCFEETLQKLANTAALKSGLKQETVAASLDTPTLTFREVNYAARLLMSKLKQASI